MEKIYIFRPLSRILLWLAYHEEWTDPMFVPGERDEVQEYAAAQEKVSFYLTDMRALPEPAGDQALFSNATLFEDADLRVKDPACQREVLGALDEGIPGRLEAGALELLLPWHGGIPLRQWLYERTPTLGQRRDACLSLLEQLIEPQGKLPPCLTALSARAENLTVDNTAVYLQYLPAFQCWGPT